MPAIPTCGPGLGRTSRSIGAAPRWSASPRSGDAPAAPGVSSFSPVICGSPPARTLVGQWEVGVGGGGRGIGDNGFVLVNRAGGQGGAVRGTVRGLLLKGAPRVLALVGGP